MDGLLNEAPKLRLTPEQAIRECEGMLECLSEFLDSAGYLKVQYTLESLTIMFPPAPVAGVADAGVAEAAQAADLAEVAQVAEVAEAFP